MIPKQPAKFIRSPENHKKQKFFAITESSRSQLFLDITQKGEQGGFTCLFDVFGLFFGKLSFLRNYKVLDGHKTIYRKFRDFFTKLKFFFEFSTLLKFFRGSPKKLSTSKTAILAPWELRCTMENSLRVKKSRFFKVYNTSTFTIMKPREKKHLTKVSSRLENFYDHSPRFGNNLKKIDSIALSN